MQASRILNREIGKLELLYQAKRELEEQIYNQIQTINKASGISDEDAANLKEALIESTIECNRGDSDYIIEQAEDEWTGCHHIELLECAKEILIDEDDDEMDMLTRKIESDMSVPQMFLEKD